MEEIMEVLGALVAVALGTIVVDWVATGPAGFAFAGSFAPNSNPTATTQATTSSSTAATNATVAIQ